MGTFRPYLRLVRDSAPREPKPTRLEQSQEPLLPISDNTLGICTSDGLDESVLFTLVTNLRPGLVLDLRTVPRFDFGRFNRRAALNLFQSEGATYMDVGASEDSEGDTAEVISNAVSGSGMLSDRPSSAVVLLDAGTDYERIAVAAAQNLRDATASRWELVLFGPLVEDSALKQTLFISHANPEDNEFVFWLEAQLTRLGYETWSDISELGPGEVFWDTIENTIRDKSVRFIAIVSRASIQKPGVLDEISLAVSIERTKRIPSFVIPLRLDDLPYGEFRANLARKNVIDFSNGWSTGLAQLVAALSKENVPRQRQFPGMSLGAWWAQRKPASLAVADTPEVLISNRFRVKALPQRLHCYSGSPIPESKRMSSPLVPLKRDLWISYYSDRELAVRRISGLTYESTLSADDFFKGTVPLTSNMPEGARRRFRHRLLNNHWEAYVCERGLKLYELTGRRPTPFIPDGLLQNNTAYFVDVDGKKKRRLLVGYSAKRSVHWHLAPLGYFSTTDETSLNLKMRVVFSEDGQGVWPSVARMRTMRRAFCKNWWNDKWRSLQGAFMAWLSADANGINVYHGDSGSFVVDSLPVSFRSPCSIREELANDWESDTSTLESRALNDDEHEEREDDEESVFSPREI